MLKGLRRFRGVQLDLESYIEKLKSRGLDADGRQQPDPVPIAPPIGYKKQPSMVELVREMVKSERLKQAAEAEGYETFEESEDFEIEDDPPDMQSPWESDYDPPVKEIEKEVTADKRRRAEAAEKAKEAPAAGGGGAQPPSGEPPKKP